MDRVSAIIAMLVASVRRKREQMDTLAMGIGNEPDGDFDGTAREIRQLNDHCELMMNICHQLHKSEDETIKKIWGNR